MTDVTPPHEPGSHDDGPHEGPIKTPKQLMLAVFFSFVIPIGLIVLLVVYVGSHSRPAAGSDALTPENTDARIAPVGMVQVKDASDVSTLKSGEQVFAAQCSTCHTAGMLGAPKFGDAAAWAPRIATGYDALLHSALAGKGNMPKQGGGDYTDFEIGRAVVYMANQAGAKFEPPAPPVAGASAPDAAAVAPAATAMPASPTAEAAPAASTAQAASPSATVTAPAAAPIVVAAAEPAKADAAGAAPALYNQICQACHALGVAGAPKLGDKAAWAPRIAQGIDALTASAIKGKGAMPPRGGSNAPDADIKAVVTYFVNSAK